MAEEEKRTENPEVSLQKEQAMSEQTKSEQAKSDQAKDKETEPEKVNSEKKKKKFLKKKAKKDGDSMTPKDFVLPVCVGVIIACLILSFTTRNGIRLKGREGSYTVYLNDDSLSKIGSYAFTSVKQNGSALVYEGNGTKVIAENGNVIIINQTEADTYTNAFVLKDQQ